MVNIVHLAFAVLQADQLLDDGNDVIAREREQFPVFRSTETRVDTITSNFSQIIPLLTEKEAFQDTASGILIRCFRSTKL